MPSNFPVSLDTFPTLTTASEEDDAGTEHHAVHNNEMAAITALQVKVGIDGSADATSLDARVATLEAGGSADLTARRIALLEAY